MELFLSSHDDLPFFALGKILLDIVSIGLLPTKNSSSVHLDPMTVLSFGLYIMVADYFIYILHLIPLSESISQSNQAETPKVPPFNQPKPKPKTLT